MKIKLIWLGLLLVVFSGYGQETFNPGRGGSGGAITGAYSFASGQFNQASVTNIAFKNGGSITNLDLVATISDARKLFVSTNGNNTTAERGNRLKPFANLTNAQVAAIAGDTIWVGPGSFSALGLGKSNVNWHFEPGAVINAGGVSLFDKAGISYNITGSGTFSNGTILDFQADFTRVNFTGARVDGALTFVCGTNSYISVTTTELLTSSEVFISDTPTDFHGNLVQNARFVALLITPAADASPKIRFFHDEMRDTGIYFDGQSTSGLEIYSRLLVGPNTDSSSAAGFAILHDDGFLTVHGTRIESGETGKMIGCDNSAVAGMRLANVSIIRTTGTNAPIHLLTAGTLQPIIEGTLYVNTNFLPNVRLTGTAVAGSVQVHEILSGVAPERALTNTVRLGSMDIGNQSRFLWVDDKGITNVFSFSTLSAGHVMTYRNGVWTNETVSGSGDVTSAAVITDEAVTRGDGGAKGIQESAMRINDAGHSWGLLNTTNSLGVVTNGINYGFQTTYGSTTNSFVNNTNQYNHGWGTTIGAVTNGGGMYVSNTLNVVGSGDTVIHLAGGTSGSTSVQAPTAGQTNLLKFDLVNPSAGQTLRIDNVAVAGGTNITTVTNISATGTGDAVLINSTAISDSVSFTNTTATATVAGTTWSVSAQADPNPDLASVAIGAASGTVAGIITAGDQTLSGTKSIGTVNIQTNINIADAVVTNNVKYLHAALVPQSQDTNYTADFTFATRSKSMTNAFHLSAVSNLPTDGIKSWTCILRNFTGTNLVASLATTIPRNGTNFVTVANAKSAMITLMSDGSGGANITNLVGSITLFDSP